MNDGGLFSAVAPERQTCTRTNDGGVIGMIFIAIGSMRNSGLPTVSC
jgi:hypothetical protein